MREFLANLRAATREFLHPQWPEPPRDETTPKLIADWIAGHRHPAACDSGCQCGKEKEVT